MAVVMFDATRLFMRASRTSPTGIDRVTEAYGRWLLGRQDVRLVPVCSLGGVLTPLSLRRFKQILDEKRSTAPTSETHWRALLRALEAPVAPEHGLRAPPDPDPLGATRVHGTPASPCVRWPTGGQEGKPPIRSIST